VRCHAKLCPPCFGSVDLRLDGRRNVLGVERPGRSLLLSRAFNGRLDDRLLACLGFLFRGVGDGLGLQRLEFGGSLGSQPRIVFLALPHQPHAARGVARVCRVGLFL